MHRDTQTHTDIQRHADTHRHTGVQRHTQTHRHTETYTNTQTDTHRCTDTQFTQFLDDHKVNRCIYIYNILNSYKNNIVYITNIGQLTIMIQEDMCLPLLSFSLSLLAMTDVKVNDTVSIYYYD